MNVPPRDLRTVAESLLRECERFRETFAKHPGIADFIATPGFTMPTSDLEALARRVLEVEPE